MDNTEAQAFEQWSTEMHCKNVSQAIRECIEFTMQNKKPANSAKLGEMV
jgi:hypothetical protein